MKEVTRKAHPEIEHYALSLSLSTSTCTSGALHPFSSLWESTTTSKAKHTHKHRKREDLETGRHGDKYIAIATPKYRAQLGSLRRNQGTKRKKDHDERQWRKGSGNGDNHCRKRYFCGNTVPVVRLKSGGSRGKKWEEKKGTKKKEEASKI